MGGNIVGFNLNTEGVVIVGSNAVFTREGSKEPILDSDLREGDTIKLIEGQEIKSIYDIDKILNSIEYAGRDVEPLLPFLRSLILKEKTQTKVCVFIF